MAGFYAARDSNMPPLLWPSIAPPFTALVASFSPPLLAGEWKAIESSDWVSMDATWVKLTTQLASGSKAPAEYRTILNIIGKAEAGRLNYDAVVLSVRIQPPKPPTLLTLSEINTWIAATPGQNHAIGRYQFVPDTLRRMITKAALRPSQRFTPAIQDRLAMQLIDEAGFAAYQAGRLSPKKFIDNLAAIWAGLPLANGKSVHAGVGDNKATVSRGSVLAALPSQNAVTVPSEPASSSGGAWLALDDGW